MQLIDVGIIGAGPCGLACAISLAKGGYSVALIECGKNYGDRQCYVDIGDVCHKCESCSVISGFGGSVHYGDSAKFSYYPSGKALYNKIQSDYERLRTEACRFWGINDDKEFVLTKMKTSGFGFETKEYPVCIKNSADIKVQIESFYSELTRLHVTYVNDEMVEFLYSDNRWKILLKKGNEIECKKIVLAMGRRGIQWLQKNIVNKGLKIYMPESTIGFRFELPKKYLQTIGKMHPDFKARVHHNGYKYKTFCYCGGHNGGRIKLENYGDYVLLDGHILTESDVDSGYGNFSLLRRMNSEYSRGRSVNRIVTDVLQNYKRISNGQPIYQSYYDFKNQIDSVSGTGISVRSIKPGPVYKLLLDGLEEYCNVAEKIFKYIAFIENVSIEEIEGNINVVGLELEGLWNRVETKDFFQTNIDGLYVGGDCGGETQGILQATIMGMVIAEGIKKEID